MSKLAFFFLVLLGIIFSCKDAVQLPSMLTDTPGDALQVTTKWCSSCHLFPDPGLLTKKIWQEKVLPNMGCRLGVQTTGYTPIETSDMMEGSLILETKVYPEQPLITLNDWARISTYIVDHAPDSFIIPQDHVLPLKEFEVIPKGALINKPFVTLLNYDSTTQSLRVGLESGKLFTYDPHWIRKDSIHLHTTPIDYVSQPDGDYILTIGKLYPSERKTGSLYKVKDQGPRKILDALHRPVAMAVTDMNGDKNKDIVISQFGFESGSFSWFESRDTGIIPRPRVLKGIPGAIKSMVEDMDGDGIKDLVVLMAQGDEHVSIYKMNLKGIEKEYQVLRFVPVHGVCDLDIKDFNADGKPDLIIANGDNADYSRILKPYHGITVYLNQGDTMHFKEFQFIPYPGVLHCIALDFDQDGDMDIAATSFFPGDETHPYAPFKYFEQKNGKFLSKTFDHADRGKWMQMIVGDFDQDGDQDLLLGSFLLNTFLVKGNQAELNQYSLVLLKNRRY